jgi:hypothetical protein
MTLGQLQENVFKPFLAMAARGFGRFLSWAQTDHESLFMIIDSLRIDQESIAK